MTDLPPFLTTEEAAQLLNVSTLTIVRWIKKGELPSSKIGRAYRIPRDAIQNRVTRVIPRTRIIAVANQKGGVAKTTTTLNVAAGLARAGKRTLIVDLDPQGGSGVSLGIATDALNRTVYNVLLDDEVAFPDIITTTNFGFDLAPSNIDLAGAEVELKQLLAAEQVLKRKLDAIKDSYDFILFDCPPSLGMLTVNALTAANEVLIPMSMELLALRGLNMLAKTIAKVRAVTNPNLVYLGMIATKYDRRTLNSREIFEALEQAARSAGIRLFNTYVTYSVRFIEAPGTRRPLLIADPEHEGSRAYTSIIEEIING